MFLLDLPEIRAGRRNFRKISEASLTLCVKSLAYFAKKPLYLRFITGKQSKMTFLLSLFAGQKK